MRVADEPIDAGPGGLEREFIFPAAIHFHGLELSPVGSHQPNAVLVCFASGGGASFATLSSTAPTLFSKGLTSVLQATTAGRCEEYRSTQVGGLARRMSGGRLSLYLKEP